MIRLDAVGRRYGSTWALHQVSLTVPRGETHALVGPNAAGKTTALRVLATLEAPTRGTASVGGADAGSRPEAVRRRIGYLGHDAPAYGALTPREHLAFDARARGLDPEEAPVDDLLARLDLPPDGRAGRLSRGNLRRLGLARALVGDPPVLLLDEPFADLDPLAREAVADLLSEGDRTALVATHDLDRGAALGERVHVLRDGRLAGSLEAGDPSKASREARTLLEEPA